MTDWREVISSIKRKHNISYSEIARRLGYSNGALQGWLNYGATPRAKAQEKLLKLAGGE
jgi:transcriptional regulator with XRE-family HTH domain